MTKELIHDTAKQLFHEVIDEMSRELGTATVQASRMFLLQTEYVCDELIADLVSHLIGSSCLSSFLQSIVACFIIGCSPVCL